MLDLGDPIFADSIGSVAGHPTRGRVALNLCTVPV
jgi:hypothetical protein